jgi:hypothetical protein
MNNEKVVEPTEEEDLPQLHKEYHQRQSVATVNNDTLQRQNSPNEYELYNNNDSDTLHDNSTPPRGFSFDKFVVHKPNQVKDQQPLTFIEGQQQQSSTSSFYLHPTTTPSTPVSFTHLVKPSI